MKIFFYILCFFAVIGVTTTILWIMTILDSSGKSGQYNHWDSE